MSGSTSPRDALRAAMASRAEAKEAHATTSFAVEHTIAEMQRLVRRKDVLEASERRRSEGLSARVIAAIKTGATPPIGEAPSAEAMSDRLKRLEIDDAIKTATLLLADLQLADKEAALASAAADKAFNDARHAVLKQDAIGIAAELVTAQIEVGALKRRLLTYAETLPLVPTYKGMPGLRMIPNEIDKALNAEPPEAATQRRGRMTIQKTLPDGRLTAENVQLPDPLFEVEDLAWSAYIAALDVDPDAHFPSPG